ncbi:hypothetical protein M5D96_000260, partial [Drosophila gunungcola]
MKWAPIAGGSSSTLEPKHPVIAELHRKQNRNRNRSRNTNRKRSANSTRHAENGDCNIVFGSA